MWFRKKEKAMYPCDSCGILFNDKAWLLRSYKFTENYQKIGTVKEFLYCANCHQSDVIHFTLPKIDTVSDDHKFHNSRVDYKFKGTFLVQENEYESFVRPLIRYVLCEKIEEK